MFETMKFWNWKKKCEQCNNPISKCDCVGHIIMTLTEKD